MSFAFTTAGASDNRAVGSSGKLYRMDFDKTATSTGTIKAGTWFRVTGKAAKGGSNPSKFGTLEVGQVMRAGVDIDLSKAPTGDACQTFTPVAIAAVRDISGDLTKEKFDVTTQTDKMATYAISATTERSGSIEGVFVASDSFVQAVLSEFSDGVHVDASGTLKTTSISSSVFHLLLSRDETSNPEVWEYLPVRLEKVSGSKPQKDAQTLSISYTAEGKERPHILFIKK